MKKKAKNKLFGVDSELEVSVTKKSLDTHVCVHTLLSCTYVHTQTHVNNTYICVSIYWEALETIASQ